MAVFPVDEANLVIGDVRLRGTSARDVVEARAARFRLPKLDVQDSQADHPGGGRRHRGSEQMPSTLSHGDERLRPACTCRRLPASTTGSYAQGVVDAGELDGEDTPAVDLLVGRRDRSGLLEQRRRGPSCRSAWCCSPDAGLDVVWIIEQPGGTRRGRRRQRPGQGGIRCLTLLRGCDGARRASAMG